MHLLIWFGTWLKEGCNVFSTIVSYEKLDKCMSLEWQVNYSSRANNTYHDHVALIILIPFETKVSYSMDIQISFNLYYKWSVNLHYLWCIFCASMFIWLLDATFCYAWQCHYIAFKVQRIEIDIRQICISAFTQLSNITQSHWLLIGTCTTIFSPAGRD